MSNTINAINRGFKELNTTVSNYISELISQISQKDREIAQLTKDLNTVKQNILILPSWRKSEVEYQITR